VKNIPKANQDDKAPDTEISNAAAKEDVCGIIMPISAIENCPESHWQDVIKIIGDSVKMAGFEPNIVSNADNAGIILKTIVRNLYWNPIVVCDVSCRNPNVMFELGMRLAFDKPVVIIKDDKTSYSFDTSGIEHIEYPRDLRYNVITGFKEKLAEKIRATHEKSKGDREQNSFLRNFGDFTVAVLEQKEVPVQQFLLDEIEGIKEMLRKIDVNNNNSSNNFVSRDLQSKYFMGDSSNLLMQRRKPGTYNKFEITGWPIEKIGELMNHLKKEANVATIETYEDSDLGVYIKAYFRMRDTDLDKKLNKIYTDIKSTLS